MGRGWTLALGLILAAVIIVLVAIKIYRYRVEVRLKPPGPPLSEEEKKIPSMLRALPFKKETPPQKPSLLVSSLKDNQLLLANVLATPKKAPRGTYLRVSVVLNLSSKDLARKYHEQKARLEALISDTIQRIPYRDLRSSEGPRILKETLEKRLKKAYKKQITALWITTYEFQRLRGL